MDYMMPVLLVGGPCHGSTVAVKRGMTTLHIPLIAELTAARDSLFEPHTEVRYNITEIRAADASHFIGVYRG